MKFKNLDKMKVLTDKEMRTLLGGDCKSCSQSCRKACSQGQKSGGGPIIVVATIV